MLKYRGPQLVRAGFIGFVLIVLTIAVGLQPESLRSWATSVRYQAVFSDASGLLDAGVADLPVDGIGVDFFLTHTSAVPNGLDKLLFAGVVDARSSLLEDPHEIARFVAGLGVERVALVPNGDLQFVAEPIAREKVARLGRAEAMPVEEAA